MKIIKKAKEYDRQLEKREKDKKKRGRRGCSGGGLKGEGYENKGGGWMLWFNYIVSSEETRHVSCRMQNLFNSIILLLNPVLA